MKDAARRVPGYDRLCQLSRRLPTLDPAAVHAMATVHAVGVELACALQESLARQGTSEGRLRVLSSLIERPQAATHSELAEESGVTRGTITGLIDGLEQDGYVQRQPDSEDRRVMRIQLTAAGHAYLDKILPDHLSRLSRMMSGLTKEEQRALVALLGKVRRGIPALLDENPDLRAPDRAPR